MDVKRLEVFLVVAEAGSFTKAAERLFTSQPAVSMQIKTLEHEAGFRLFERERKNSKLTKEGCMLFLAAQKVQEGVREAQRVADEIRGLKKGVVLIGASSTPGVYLLPEIIADFKKKYPAIQIKLKVNNTQTVVNDILSGQVDMGFVGEGAHAAGICEENFVQDSIIPVLPRGHKLLRENKISIKSFLKEPLILREEGSATRSLVEEALRRKNLRFENVVMEVGNPEGIKRAVMQGLGVSFLSWFAIRQELKERKLHSANLSDFSVRRTLTLITREQKWLSFSVRTFMEFCRKRKR